MKKIFIPSDATHLSKRLLALCAISTAMAFSLEATGVNSLNSAHSNGSAAPLHTNPTDSVNVADSAYNILPGIDVTAAKEFHTAEGSFYTPTKQEKNISRDALDLLNLMAIPQLRKDVNGNFTAANGALVNYYINGHPAESDELNGMNMANVKKVCFLDHPSDPKYLGAQYVVEFILQEYEYGGYTKLQNQTYFIGQYHFNERLNSKFSYKRMTYDLSAMIQNFGYRRSYMQNTETINLKDYTVVKSEKPDYGRFNVDNYPVQFRAVYSHGRAYISNQIGFGFNSKRNHNTGGTVTFDKIFRDNQPAEHQSYDYNLSEPHDSYTASWRGFASFYFDKGWSLSASTKVGYLHYDRHRKYTTTEPFSIDQDIYENSVDADLNLSLGKQLGRNSLSLEIDGSILSSHTRYTGTSNFRNSFSFPSMSAKVRYSLNLNNLAIRAYAGIGSEWNRLNDFRSNTTYPFALINANYSPNRKSSASLWIQYSTFSPLANSKNPTPVRISEFMYRYGNPELKSYPKFEIAPSYTWSPSGQFSLSAMAVYTHMHNTIREVYNLNASGDAVDNTYDNQGNTNTFNANMSARVSLFSDKLRIMANPSITVNRGSGIYMPDHTSYSVYASATLYLGNFYVGADGRFGSKYYSSTRMDEITKLKTSYNFHIGWGNGNLTLYAGLYNIFSGSWKASSSYVYSPVYSAETAAFNVSARHSFMIAASYTFGYGKKLNDHSELDSFVEGATSVIL